MNMYIPDITNNVELFVNKQITLQGVMVATTWKTTTSHESFPGLLGKSAKYISILPKQFYWFSISREEVAFLVPSSDNIETGLLRLLTKPNNLWLRMLKFLPTPISRCIIKKYFPESVVKINCPRLRDILKKEAFLRFEIFPWRLFVDISGQVERSSCPEYAFTLNNVTSIYIKSEPGDLQEEKHINLDAVIK